jgi:hypothetical protein
VKDTCLIKDEVIAKKAWEALKAAHQPSGVLSQLTLLQQTLALWYSHNITLTDITEKLNTLIDSFFAIRPPTEDVLHHLPQHHDELRVQGHLFFPQHLAQCRVTVICSRHFLN